MLDLFEGLFRRRQPGPEKKSPQKVFDPETRQILESSGRTVVSLNGLTIGDMISDVFGGPHRRFRFQLTDLATDNKDIYGIRSMSGEIAFLPHLMGDNFGASMSPTPLLSLAEWEKEAAEEAVKLNINVNTVTPDAATLTEILMNRWIDFESNMPGGDLMIPTATVHRFGISRNDRPERRIALVRPLTPNVLNIINVPRDQNTYKTYFPVYTPK